ncbi:MAG: transglycosylase domain-containing protein [Alphaproteobacteria bacterium]|nr:transglycosylase domain-containing protein [Alphaproteobacteria bacterium]
MIRGWAFLVLLLAVLVPAVERVLVADVIPALDERLAGLQDWRPPSVVRVLDRHGAPLDEFSLVRRVWVPLDALPDAVWQAVVASEDSRYFEHVGVDPVGILRAAWVNLQAGRIVEGGSTLTQQLVKNLVVGSERSYGRKLEEALLAWRLDRTLGKRRVLELYLNYVYLGSGNYGVEAAARDYFGHPAAALDAAEAALLAGLIPAPSAYSPRRNPVLAASRRGMVLDRMVTTGVLDAASAAAAKEEPVDPPRRETGREVGTAYITAVRREVRRLLGDQLPFEVGLTVHTPYDPALQAIAEEAVRKAAAAVERRQGPRRSGRVLAKGAAVDAFLAEGRGLPRAGDELVRPSAGACFPAVHLEGDALRAGPFRYRMVGEAWRGPVWDPDDEAPRRTLGQALERGELLEVCLRADGLVEPAPRPWAEGAAVVLDTETAEVVALVGGRQVALEGFLRATQARRQAGSSFKPYVYATALAAGRGLLDTVVDAPIALPSGNGGTWSPQNYSGGFRGALPLRSAFAASLNTVAVRLILSTGAQRVATLAQRAGIRSTLRVDPTLALGSSEVTVLEHTAALAGIVRGGVPRAPVFVRALEDMLGRPVGTAGARVNLPGVDLVLPGEPGVRFLEAGAAWETVELMLATVQEGTGRAARRADEERGGKTGTSSDYTDAWFVGFTPTHTLSVWLGQDSNQTLGPGETGGRAALPAWIQIADALPPGPASLPRPPEVVPVPSADRWLSVRPSHVGRDVLVVPGLSPRVPLPAFPTPVPAACPPVAAEEGAP